MEVKTKIKEILLQDFIQTSNPDELKFDTPLISTGILDSISILQMVDKLEKAFQIEFEAHEIDRENFDTIERMEGMVNSKKS